MKVISCIVLFMCCVLCSCTCCAQKPKFNSLTPKDFEILLKDSVEVQLVDVRRPEEFEAGHLDKAVLINVLTADFVSKANQMLDKSKPVAVYCRTGRRSKDAANLLVAEGFRVFELDSGIVGWTNYMNTKK